MGDGKFTANTHPIDNRRYCFLLSHYYSPSYFLKLNDGEALDTGRCYLIEKGLTDVNYPTDIQDMDIDDYDILDTYY